MDIKIKNLEKIEFDNIFLQKMIFINNALDKGWKIEKNDKKYIFTKKSEKSSEYYLDNYVSNFIIENLAFSEDN